MLTYLDHCVEILRQFIMCHVDVGVVTSHVSLSYGYFVVGETNSTE
jgi:hypothetical protein